MSAYPDQRPVTPSFRLFPNPLMGPSLPPLYLHLLSAAADGALCDIPEKKSLCDPLAPAVSQLYGLFDVKPKPGDLIEIFRGPYQHWAVYIGNGFVIHLAPPNTTSTLANTGCATACCMNTVLSVRTTVKKEELHKVVGNDKYRINNLLDDKYKPRDPCDIVKDAQSLLGQEQPYCVFNRNCEHFSTDLRYGKAESRQVRQAMEVGGVGVAAMIGLGVLAAAAVAVFGGGSKEKKSNQ
ncbi:hypothetical protein SKAU_G00369660 [Synaphobranchus kaupii]|uniref:LRAT domain-containing protein n=1 Tax=Synaphobranchus kaupii TaxID=118154 RepID=A0A9Q1EFU1_SYNKA|nr:hypothetical protein SKAU_G00369660 [Synaphobranchus kaupii]